MSFKLAVVDDDGEVLATITEMLQAIGYETTAFPDSRAAAEQLDSDRFDAIILDRRMPNLDGVELARKIRKSPVNRTAPIAMLTAHGDTGTMRDAFDAGVTLFISKPVTARRLQQVVTVLNMAVRRQQRAQRRAIRTAVTCRRGDTAITAQLINVSESGMLVEGVQATRGDEFDVEFQLPGHKHAFRTCARVAREVSENRIALEFVNAAPALRETLRKFTGS